MSKPLSLYQRFLEEREEILKHKWLESEKVSYDIGFERALVDWMKNHRKAWLKSKGYVFKEKIKFKVTQSSRMEQ